MTEEDLEIDGELDDDQLPDDPLPETILAAVKHFSEKRLARITGELLDATKVEVKKGESLKALSGRVCKLAHELDEDAWGALSPGSQYVVNNWAFGQRQKPPKHYSLLVLPTEEKAEEPEESKVKKQKKEKAKAAAPTKSAEKPKAAAAPSKPVAAKGKAAAPPKKAAAAKTEKTAKPAPKPVKAAKPHKGNGRNGIELKEGTKNALLLAMVKDPKGASMRDMLKRTKWTAEKSVRAVISGVFRTKLGLEVTCKEVNGENRYFCKN